MSVPGIDNNFGLDTSDRNSDGRKSGGSDLSMQDKARKAGSIVDNDGDENPAQIQREGGSNLGSTLLRMAQDAYEQGTTFHQSAVRPAWVRSYLAYSNKHFTGSKYGSKEYSSRSKIFRPKTRSAVRRAMAQGAQALFSTGDIVAITAQNEADQFQVASASVKQELMNYRLSRTTRKNGIRWFMVAMGALQDAKIAGLVVSKQTWKFKERKTTKQIQTMDPWTGLPFWIEQEASEIVEDRPDIHLFAPENCIFDPNADWTNPAQLSQYVDLRYPMSADEAAEFLKNNKANKRIPFYSMTREALQGYADNSGPADTIGVRSAREQGKDPVMLSSGNFGRLWLHEWFIRWDGEDWCFWTINNNVLLSDPVPVSEAYPEQGGERPIVIGYGALESHRAYPMSPVESWQQMQAEINDQVNLRLDHMKQVVAPQMKVVRGRKVDLSQVQRRGPNGIIMVQSPEDVESFPVPDVPQSAFVENNYLNQDFDDLAGAFNPSGTEQSNAGASETMGGLSLLANNANTMGEFDLTVFVETWVSPVLCQLMKLEEMYESDATVLAICGDRAKLFEKFGTDVITDKMLMAETTVQIKAGVGAAAHPLERMQKFQMAVGAMTGFFTPFIQAGKMQWPQPRPKEIADFIFGAVGIPEGAERFFSNMDQLDGPMPPMPPPPDPKAQAMQAANQIKAQQVQVGAQKAQMDNQTKQMAIQQKAQDTAIKADQAAKDRTAEILKEHLRAEAEIRHAELASREARGMQWRDHAHARGMQAVSTFHDLLKAGANAAINPKPQNDGPAQ